VQIPRAMTIQKKQTCAAQIISLLGEEIVPKLDALREEKPGRVKFVQGEVELERVGRVLREWVEGGKGRRSGMGCLALLLRRLVLSGGRRRWRLRLLGGDEGGAWQEG
jgi:hypothetical protein